MASAAQAAGDGPKPEPRAGYHRMKISGVEFVVDVRYKNLKAIGRGAYGCVASADDTTTGKKVAIKKIDNIFRDLVDGKRILREINLLRHLAGHPNVISIRDAMIGPQVGGKAAGDFTHLYVVTDLYECDLEKIITSSQALTVQHLQFFMYQVLRGLAFVHSANVIHRDLKPSNLLVNSNCDLAICDFGLSRGAAGEGEAKLTEYVVTRWYRAPEILCEAKTYGTQTDMWSAGCIMAELIRRRPLFKGRNTRQQLQLIVNTLGTPSEQEMLGFTSVNARQAIRGMEKVAQRSVRFAFPGLADTSPEAADLLDRLLRWAPESRLTAAQALEHPFFGELRQRFPMRSCQAPFDFGYELEYPRRMPREVLSRRLLESVREIQTMVGTDQRSGGEEAAAAAGGGAQ